MYEEQNQNQRTKSLYNIPDLNITFQEYIPGGPAGPIQKGKLFGQGLEYEIDTQPTTITVPSIVTTHSGGTTSTAAAHTITETVTFAKQFTIFYCYAADGIIKKVLPENISILNYKTI